MHRFMPVFAFSLIVAACTPVQKTRTPLATPLARVVENTVLPPARKAGIADPVLTAVSAVVLDVASGQVIFAKNPTTHLMPASTTKMMTMMVALDAYQPDEIITVNRGYAAVGHAIDIMPTDQFKALNLITAMMVNSGNDAAVSLADHYPGGYDAFVAAMNRQAKILGMKNTHFTNVSGVEEVGHFSSAEDLAILGQYVMQNDIARSIVNTKAAAVSTVDRKHTYRLENLNELLWDVEGAVGIKTGWTPLAKDCLVTYIDREHDLIFVVLKSNDRFADSRQLIDWTYQSFVWDP